MVERGLLDCKFGTAKVDLGLHTKFMHLSSLTSHGLGSLHWNDSARIDVKTQSPMAESRARHSHRTLPFGRIFWIMQHIAHFVKAITTTVRIWLAYMSSQSQ